MGRAAPQLGPGRARAALTSRVRSTGSCPAVHSGCRVHEDPREGGIPGVERETGTFRVKSGLAEMLKGGVIMDVTTADQAKIAEDAGAVRGDGARASSGRHPCRGRGRPHGRCHQGRGDHERGLGARDGQGPHRSFRRGADPPGARRRLRGRVRGAHAGRRGAPHRQVGVHGPVRLRRPEPGRGASADRRGRGDDPHQGRGGYRQRRRGRPPPADDAPRDRVAPEPASRAARRGREGSRARPSTSSGWSPRPGSSRS